jgi:hypothetical protein
MLVLLDWLRGWQRERRTCLLPFLYIDHFSKTCQVKPRDANQLLPRSHLFTVRLWTEPLGDGRFERRGRVQHVLSGERRYFRDWPALVGYLERKLQELNTEETP